MTGLLLVLISILFSFTVEAQTGIDMPDTPHLNCALGGQDFNLNSSTRECRKGFLMCSTVNTCPEGFHTVCPDGFHCEGMLSCPTGFHTEFDGICVPN